MPLRADMLTPNSWLLFIKEEGLEKPDVGLRVCVFRIFGSGDVHLWESQTLILEEGSAGEVSSRGNKNHAIVSLNQVY